MALEVFLTIQRQNQTTIIGESTDPEHPKAVEALGYSFDLTRTGSSTTGAGSGKAQPSPVVITKTWDSASPQLFSIGVSGETLPSVLIEFVQLLAGKNQVFFSIELHNVVITGFKQYIGVLPGQPNDIRQLEEVSFDAPQISFKHNQSNTVGGFNFATQKLV